MGAIEGLRTGAASNKAGGTDNEGKTIVKMFIRTAALAIACATTAAGLATAAASPAFASATTATTLTVTANHPTTTTGKSETFTALVAPAKVGTTKISGSVSWSVTGHDGTLIPCTVQTPLSGSGKSKCAVGKLVLHAQNSPYTAVATYSGDATFIGSTGTTSVSIGVTTAHLKLVLDAKPTNGVATTATATVVGGSATPLVGGNVVFTISSQLHASGVAVLCTGSAVPASANNIKPLVSQVAVCNLPAGWMVLPKVTTNNPKPSDGWSISAIYNGNSDFTTSFSTKSGTAKS
jgi:hypothetical protein